MITDKATIICDTSWTVREADLYIEELWNVKTTIIQSCSQNVVRVDIDKDDTSGINRTLRRRLYCSFEIIMIVRTWVIPNKCFDRNSTPRLSNMIIIPKCFGSLVRGIKGYYNFILNQNLENFSRKDIGSLFVILSL